MAVKRTEFFANKCNPDISGKYLFKPQIEVFQSMFELDTAENSLYVDIAPLAFKKEKIVSFLSDLTESKVYVPGNINSKQKYIDTYVSIGKSVLNDINHGVYPFQKP